MISNLKAYPTTKASGIEWLEDIPAHWQVRQLKTLCSESALYGANIPATSYVTAGVRFLRTTDITEDGQLERRGVFLPLELVRDYQLVDGDLLFSRSGTVGRSFLYDRKKHGPCSYAGYLVRFVPGPNVRPRFIYWFSKSLAFTGFLKAMTISSTIENVNGAKYAACPLPLPLLSEQSAITRYLDYLDRRVQRYIRAKEKLIALLEEYKQALLHQAVTGQIDVRTGEPYAEYKESRVEWLGKVPEHWNIRRLRSLAHIKTGGKDTIDRQSDGKYPFFVRSQTVENINSWSFDGEAVLTAGDGVGVGKVFHYINGKFDYHQRVYNFSDFRDVIGKFFFHYFRATLRFEVYQGTAKSTVDSLRLPMLQDFPVVLPARSEQAPIVLYIDRTAADTESAIARAQRSIELLHEYRTRLIADVVTGKLDVREATAALPEVDPPEAHESIGVTPHENQKLELDKAAAA